MSIELFFLANHLIDFGILAAATRALGQFRLRRVLPASILAALYALLPAWLHAPSAQAALLLALSAWLGGCRTPWSVLRTALTLYVCAATAGTTARWLAGYSGFRPASPVAALLGAMTASRCARLQSRRASAETVTVQITSLGHTAVLEALIDTGNRLREPLSGQPVVIAGESALRSILPARGYRAVAYGSVGGDGTLRCFRPSAVHILRRGVRRRGAEVWIAVYPGRLPGGVAALAPAELIS